MSSEMIDIADFHSHIIPRLDHGSDSLNTSIKQLELAKKYGVTRIVATSHFYPHVHTLKTFLDSRGKLAEELLKNKSADLPEVKLGAEVLLCDGLDRLEGLEKLCLAGTRYLLLELPFIDFKEAYCDTVESIMEQGIEVILAHADRYPHQNIEQLIERGVNKLQLNAPSLSHLFKNRELYDWIDRGLVVAIGSDIHQRDEAAYKKFSKAKSNLSYRLEQIKKKSDEIWYSISEYR